MQEEFAALRRADAEYQHLGQGPRLVDPFSVEALRARALVFEKSALLLQAMDPRCADLLHLSVGAQLGLLLLEGIGSPLATLASDEWVWGTAWHRVTTPTFVLTSGLAANLLLTDPTKVLEDDIAWPFPAFRVQLPFPDCGIDFLHPDGVTSMRMRSIHALSWQGLAREDAVKASQVSIPLTGVRDARTLEEAQRAVKRVVDASLVQLREVPEKPMFLVRGYGVDGVSLFQNQP